MDVMRCTHGHRALRVAAVVAAVSWGAARGAAATTAAAPQPPVRIAPGDPASLQKGIEAAWKAGLKRIVVPAGIYRPASPGGRFYLAFADLADFEIDARGATLLRADPTKGGIEFLRCRNVALRGLALANETPPFTQGAIAAVDPKGLWYEVRIDQGYPAAFDDPKFFPAAPTGYLFDPATRQWKPDSQDFYCTRAERRGPDLFRIHFDRPRMPDAENVALGDLMAFRGNGRTDIYVGRCSGMRIEGVAIRSGGGFCIHEDGGEGGNRYTYTVTYGPKPQGADAAPLIACNADAFHSSGVRRGPTLEGCLFEGMPDDGIPIHGAYAMVVEADGATLTVCTVGDNFFRAGDPLRLFDPEGGFAGEAVVQAVGPAQGFQPKVRTTRERYKNSTRFFRLTLDRALPARFECLVSDPAANGSGYVVRNNVIRNHRARGMLLKADDGLVEGNIVEGSTIAGIVLAPELWWNEACYSRNVVLRGNTVRRVGYATVGPWTGQAGAITVLGEGKGAGRPGHRRLVIENNTIADCDGVNLLVTSAQDVRVAGNRFVRPMTRPTRRGADHGLDTGALVWLGDCRDVRFEGNTVVEAGPCLHTLVGAAPTAEDVSGLPEGIAGRQP